MGVGVVVELLSFYRVGNGSRTKNKARESASESNWKNGRESESELESNWFCFDICNRGLCRRIAALAVFSKEVSVVRFAGYWWATSKSRMTKSRIKTSCELGRRSPLRQTHLRRQKVVLVLAFSNQLRIAHRSSRNAHHSTITADQIIAM